MGALTGTIPTRLGTSAPGNPVASTDTIAAALLGVNGALLEIIGGASPDNMTISDAGKSPSGTPAVPYAATVAASGSSVFKIDPRQVDLATGLVTITHSFITGVTYKLFTLG